MVVLSGVRLEVLFGGGEARFGGGDGAIVLEWKMVGMVVYALLSEAEGKVTPTSAFVLAAC